jgi:rhodanese-related sulfurtransferase
MTTQPARTNGGAGYGRIKGLVVEALLVTVAGGLFALTANQLSPNGIRLTRNYFPKPPPLATNQPAAQPVVAAPPIAAVAAVTPEARLRAAGLQTVPRETVAQLFTSPEYASESVIFVDARNDEHYQAGHLPGAFAFDHYRPETCVATVLPACLAATRIVVYCTGGDCEDSEFATIALAGSGVPREKLFIYTGGLADWQAAGQPVETGARRSGQFLPAKPATPANASNAVAPLKP